MSTVVAKNVQVGTSGTATDNFTIRQPATPDGTVRIANGNSGTTTDLVTVTSAGNVGVGTSSPGQKLDVAGSGNTFGRVSSGNNATRAGWIATSKSSGGADVTMNLVAYGDSPEVGLYATTNHPLTFGNNNTERARIDSSGNLLVGTTSGTGGRIVSESNLFDESNTNAWKNGAFNGRGSFGGPLAFVNTGGASDGFAFYLTGNPSQLNIRFGANAGAVSAGVYMTSTATSWTAQSDERLKDITGTITDAVQSVKSLRPVRYTLKADQDKTHRVGLIAQDVQKVLPEVVDTDAKGYLGVRYSEIVPLLVAAIQEQQAMIEQLKADVAALKGTV